MKVAEQLVKVKDASWNFQKGAKKKAWFEDRSGRGEGSGVGAGGQMEQYYRGFHIILIQPYRFF